jgi:membrane associated rhomboid family serine protease
MKTIMRIIVTMVWSTIFCLIIGFIASSLTQMRFNLAQSAIIGAIFGFLYALIIPTITAHSVQDKSKYSKL